MSRLGGHSCADGCREYAEQVWREGLRELDVLFAQYAALLEPGD